MKAVILVTLSLLLFCGYSSYANSEINLVKFVSMPCINPSVDVILKTSSIKEVVTISILRCAISCAKNENCNFAIYRQSVQACKHIFSYDGATSNPSPTYINENDCFVLKRRDKPICKNGGSFHGKYACHCRNEFQGRLCEEAKPSFCVWNGWRFAFQPDYLTLHNSMLRIKLLTPFGSSSRQISDVSFFFSDGIKSRFESHNFLSLDPLSDNFESPLKREFNFYSDWSGKSTTKRVSMSGVETTTQDSTFSYNLLFRQSTDSNRLVYEAGVQENVDNIIDNLETGFGLQLRSPARTEFDKTSGDVVFQRPKDNIGAGSGGYLSPLYHYSAKHSVRHKKKYITRWYITTGTVKSSGTYPENPNVELDRCWFKINLYENDEELLGLLQEVVISLGKEIRLMMAASVATDVTMVTVTDSDIIVALAEYLTPSDADTPLGSSSRIRFTGLSFSKIVVQCEMTFQGSTVHDIKTEIFPSSLEWIVSCRDSDIVFVVDSTGTVISGSHQDVYSAAQIGKNIRVCIETTEYTSVCFTGTALNLDDASKHIMMQSHPTLGVGLNWDRTFSGVVDSDCRRTAYLVSTKGWMKSATYVTGVEDPPDAISSVSFIKISWFRET